MKKFLLLATMGVVLAGPVYAQSIPEKTGINSTLGIAPKTEDFVKQVAMSDMFEIESGKLAASKGAATKQFGSQMVADHTKTSGELKALLSSASVNVQLPMAPDDAHKKKLDKLASLVGNEFDRQYAADQVEAHEDAVNLFDRYAKGGENAQLKAWAAKTVPALRHHLDMAKKLPR